MNRTPNRYVQTSPTITPAWFKIMPMPINMRSIENTILFYFLDLWKDIPKLII